MAWLVALFHKSKCIFFTPLCYVLCELCESVLALRWCAFWGVVGVPHRLLAGFGVMSKSFEELKASSAFLKSAT
jgi:hypothetical protein